MWALIVAHFGQNFGFLILLTEMPSYLNGILHFDIKTVSFYFIYFLKFRINIENLLKEPLCNYVSTRAETLIVTTNLFKTDRKERHGTKFYWREIFHVVHHFLVNSV